MYLKAKRKILVSIWQPFTTLGMSVWWNDEVSYFKI